MRIARALVLVAAVAAVLSLMPRAAEADGAWLDRMPPVQWNTAGMQVPQAPKGEIGDPRCLASERPAETVEDSIVTDAGWHLFNSYPSGWGIRAVMATSGYDGMCRPYGYQVFVFVDAAYAGTISPEIMSSRTDGSGGVVQIFGADQLSTSFARYKDTDPLCCPSATSSATYKINRTAAGPVLVLDSVFTNPNSGG